MPLACQPVYLMLCGLSLEVLMKAVLAQRGELTEKLMHHRLVDLAKAVGRAQTLREQKLLRFYESSMVWAGRYPVPLRDQLRGVIAHRRLGSELFMSPVKLGRLELKQRNDMDSWERYSILWRSYDALFANASERANDHTEYRRR